ncbi:MAG: M1 family aminopeptidase [Clostridia bacterium]|nr:M1 family aminopeptidase [Clostridia bacterium]
MRSKLLLLCILAVVAFFLLGCSQNPLKQAVKKADDVTLTLTLDTQTNTLYGAMLHRLTNRTNYNIQCAVYTLFPNVYRQNALNPAVNKEFGGTAYVNGESFGGITINSVFANGNTKFHLSGDDDYFLEIPINAPCGSVTEIEIVFEVALANVIHNLGYVGSTYSLGNCFPLPCVYSGNGCVKNAFSSIGDSRYSPNINYSATVIVPFDLSVVSTGNTSAVVESDVKTYKLQADCVRDFYVCASNELNQVDTTIDEVAVRYIYVSDSAPEDTLSLITAAFSFMNELYPYPYSVVNVMQSNVSDGVYPNVAIVNADLSDGDKTHTIVHEVARQWFYSIVHVNRAEYSFMEAGLAEYFTYLFFGKYPDYGDVSKKMKTLRTNEKAYAELLDGTDVGICRNIYTFENYLPYVYCNYIKAPIMFDDLVNTVGMKAFLKGVACYLNTYAFDSPKPQNLIDCLSKSAGTSLDKWFDNYL